MKKIIFILSSLAVLAFLNFSIYQKEKILAKGDIFMLELAPVDPRSLMQGEYMRLRYAIASSINMEAPKRGMIVIAPDARGVGRFVRYHKGESLAPTEKLLRYQNTGHEIKIIPDSFMFQEGNNAFYATAKYGIFTADAKGNTLLTGLADARLIHITPDKEPLK